MKSTRRLASFALGFSLLVAACGGAQQPVPAAAPAGGEPPPAAPLPATPVTEPGAAAPSDAPKVAYVTPETNPQPGDGNDFKAELGVLFRVLACAGETPVPKHLDQTVVDAHCARANGLKQTYKERYIPKAGPFFDGIRPKNLPPTVVYPFGGGDLLSALLVFPDALEITTISLEYAGDPRGFTAKKDKKVLEKGLKLVDDSYQTLLRGDWNWTRNMEALQAAGVPEQLGYALVALSIHGYEPLSLRYFRLAADGTVDYLDKKEIEALADRRPEALRLWGAPDYSKAFSNAEIRFQKPGGPVKVFRHMAANLSNKGMREESAALLPHLEKKGPISATTRAASHLLWEPAFSTIRDYLAKNLVWMPSDSTGLTAKDAAAAGLVQEFYGTFAGMYKPSDQDKRPEEPDLAFQKLFKEKSKTTLDFLYGYSDNRRVDASVPRMGHVIVTRRP
jgi:hypothetical protein